MLFIDRLAKVTDNAVVQGAVLVNVIGIRGNEDCRNRISRTNEVSVELNPRHPRYVDVGDQAGRFIETRGCEEFGRRWKGLDGIAKRPHEPSHGVAKEPIIFNDRNQLLFHHDACGNSLEPAMRAPKQCRRTAWIGLICVNNATGAMPVPRKLWLMPGGNCAGWA